MKSREEQTQKERQTQRRKRRTGFFHKAYQLEKLCGYEVLVMLCHPENRQYYIYKSSGRDSWPPPMEQIASHLYLLVRGVELSNVQLARGKPKTAVRDVS